LPLEFGVPRRRADFLLEQAVSAFKAGRPGDALLAAESACRLLPTEALPALLRATIVQAARPALAAAAWHQAWCRAPLDARLQDGLLQAWLAQGDTARVAALGPALLPARCRDGSHASLLSALQAAAAAPPGACWKAGDVIEGLLFGGPQTLQLQDELTQARYQLTLPAGRFRVVPPQPDGVWSLAAAAPLPGSPLAFAAPGPAAAPAAARGAALAVVIPVYRGLASVQACLASVLASLPHNRAAAAVLVIDDGSPEAALSAWLDSLAAAGRITLLRNRHNLGFIESVNRALRLPGSHDVLLLNADTLVHGDWIDRLLAALYSADDIAAVTPWSNNGEISSFPNIGVAAPAPGPAGLRRLDEAAAALRRDGMGADIELPACCGFAMLMRRAALDAVGVLDGVGLQRGYGEEVDWCLRARAAGYRHLAATGVYVAHAGGVSFGDEKKLRVRQNRAVLLARYPDYYPDYQRFLRDDPLAGPRQRLRACLAPAGAAQPARGRRPAAADTPLPSGCRRIVVWRHRHGTAHAAQLLRLARLIAARGAAAPALRLLVIGDASEALWRTGVVDLLPAAPDPAVPADDAAPQAALLDDQTLLDLVGCAVVLAEDGAAAPAGRPGVRLDAGFDAGAWLAAWLAGPVHGECRA
jgi:GT2 family glycosyltransferase